MATFAGAACALAQALFRMLRRSSRLSSYECGPENDLDRESAKIGRKDVTLEFCRKLPKVELHAHLHGSIRDETLLDLMRENSRKVMKGFKGQKANIELEKMRVELKEERTLAQCFKLFSLIHSLVASLDIVTRITVEVLEDFSRENVRYIELRTTPRDSPELGITPRSYVQAVIKGFKLAKSKNLPIEPRLLLSVNRGSNDLNAALRTIDLAIEYSRKEERYVVGVDFSGNPYGRGFKYFLPAFEKARKAGLKCAIHCGEVENHDDTTDIIKFQPERLGHAVRLNCIHSKMLQNLKLPIEICPTSNMRTLKLTDINQHPTLSKWVESNYPYCICTDDSGVFRTSLSEEIYLAAKAGSLSPHQVSKLCIDAVGMTFLDKREKSRLKEKLEIVTYEAWQRWRLN